MINSPIAPRPAEIEECYVVYPEQDSFFDFELILADAGEVGHKAIEAHYPNLKLALDADQLAAVEQQARNVPMFTTGPYWFKTPVHYFFVAIQEGVPVAKFMVEATSASDAIKRAVKAAPDCHFNIVGLLEHFQLAGKGMLAILDGNQAMLVRDLRTNKGQ